MHKGMEGSGGYKTHSENKEQSGHIRAGEALYRDFEVRNLYILQQAAGELKWIFSHSRHVERLISVFERLFSELSRKYWRRMWVLAGIPDPFKR